MMKRRATLFGVLAAVTLGMLVSVLPASAGSKGRTNTALALTGLAAYELLRGQTTNGVIAGAAATYAWKRAQDAKRAEEWDNRYGYYDPYYNGYNGYDPYSNGGYSSGYYGQDNRSCNQGYYGQSPRGRYDTYSRDRKHQQTSRRDRDRYDD